MKLYPTTHPASSERNAMLIGLMYAGRAINSNTVGRAVDVEALAALGLIETELRAWWDYEDTESQRQADALVEEHRGEPRD